MRIAVIADTHDRYPRRLPKLLADADEIWHLGDVCAPSVLIEFEQLGHPLHVVLGNNENHSAWPLELKLERNGVRFHLVHIPPLETPHGCDVILHGHTHVPRDEMRDGVRWLNPGCVSLAYRGAPASFAWLTFGQAGEYGWKVVEL